MSLPYSLDLNTLATAYANGTLTPGAVARDIHDAISGLADNPIWIHLLPLDAVARQANQLESRRNAGVSLPLYGIPFAVKDNIDVKGCPTTAACPAYAYVAEATAHAVDRKSVV